MDFKYCKLEIFIPETHLPALQKTLQEVDAGHIGNYDSCMSSSEVTGYWRPLEGCNPYIGNEGEISKEPEVKVEDIAEGLTEDEEIKDDEMITMDEEPPEDEEFDVEESDEEEAAEDEADDQASDDAEDNE